MTGAIIATVLVGVWAIATWCSREQERKDIADMARVRLSHHARCVVEHDRRAQRRAASQEEAES